MQRVVHNGIHHCLGNHGLAAPARSDHPDPIDTLFEEPIPPAGHRVLMRTNRPGGRSDRGAICERQQGVRLHHGPMRRHR